MPEILPLARRHYRTVLSAVDDVLAERAFICGDEFTAADIMISYGMSIGKVIGELPAELTHVAAYLARLKQRPAYTRAWA